MLCSLFFLKLLMTSAFSWRLIMDVFAAAAYLVCEQHVLYVRLCVEMMLTAPRGVSAPEVHCG